MAANLQLFDRANLHAWCIVPFDKGKRDATQRMQMLRELGIPRLAYDWRDEHIPLFEEEILRAGDFGIEINAWFYPWSFDEATEHSLALFNKHGIRPQLWLNGGGDFVSTAEAHEAHIRDNLERLRPFVRAAAEQGLSVALYNHGGWYGEPANQIEIIERFRQEGFTNVGLVYNQHHGHHHMQGFAELLQLMKPHLLSLNLNGMRLRGDEIGHKIMPIGQGEEDLHLLRVIAESGWQGPVGLLNHTEEDSKERLDDNLRGLEWAVRQLQEPSGEAAPVPVSWSE